MVAQKQKKSAQAAAMTGPVSAEAGDKAGLRGLSFAEGQAALSPQSQNQAETQDQAAPAPPSVGNADPKNIIAGLHPAFATRIRQLLSNAQSRGLSVYLFEGMRDHQRQGELYAQGRSKPGQVVTWVKPGGSYHQYGMAVDIVFKGAQPWGEQHNWSALGKAGQDAGLKWGGSYGDRPHFQLKGINIRQLKGWYASGGLANAWTQASKTVGGGSFDGPAMDGSDGTVRVVPGDTLGKIAQRFFGSHKAWRSIAELNGISDPTKLKVGTVLQIPNGKSTDPEASNRSIEYKIGKGDTLGRIAKRVYGDASRWEEIAAANGITDPTKLAIGQVIMIPPANGQKADIPKPDFITVTVKSGDTLGKIAAKYLGDSKRWREIAETNGIADARKISIGTELKIAQ